MYNRLIFILLGLVLGLQVQAQCTIASDSFVCVQDIIGFKVVLSSGTAAGYAWDLDDGKSSTIAQPSASYSAFGSKQITVTVTLAGGGTCQASKGIFVHDKPKADFKFATSSNFCLSKNKVCIDDLSAPGQTGSALKRRVTLFGDGAADVETNPSTNTYFCHTYAAHGYYQLVMETIDEKGCFTRHQDSMRIVKDVPALFSYSIFGNCDTAAICMTNLTKMDSSDAVSYYWDFGNGISLPGHWTGACYTYKDSGSFSPSLVLQSSAQCTDTFRQRDIVQLKPIQFDIIKNKYEGCIGDNFTFEDLRSQKDTFFWYIRREGNQIAVPLGQTNPISFSVGNPGKHFITLTARRGTCQKTFIRDSIEVFGPVAKMGARNINSCLSSDTTFFCDESDYSNTKGVKRLWEFNNKNAPKCTTDTENGINVGMNCRFSVDEKPKHLFPADECVWVKLYLKDTITGCESEAGKEFIQGPRDTSKYPLKATNMLPCDGPDPARVFNFWLDDYCGSYYIKPDSLAGNFLKIKSGAYQHNYSAVRSQSGWVTVGIILLAGDTGDYACEGNTTTPLCLDTIWYHRFIKLTPRANPSLSILGAHGCAPFEAEFELADTQFRSLSKAYWIWGDGGIDTLVFSAGDTIASRFKHTYLNKGAFQAQLLLENEVGCIDNAAIQITLGHLPKVTFNSNNCLNECIRFNDSIQYYNDTNYQWTTNRLGFFESIYWDWDDGSIDTVSHPLHCFKDTGLHEVKMISTDSTGCRDTLHIPINIGGALAKIGIQKQKILCSEIVQFFDSSKLINTSTGEFIYSWQWNWGDGSRPSTIQNPYHFYSTYQEYNIRLVIQTSKGCWDTTQFTVEVQGPKPSFEFLTDSIGCSPLAIELENTSSNAVNWIWYFGDPDSSTIFTNTDSSVKFTYTKPGTYYLRLYGADSIFNPATQNKQFCSVTYPDTSLPGQIARKVIVLPIPEADFNARDTVCINAPVALVDNSDPIYTSFNWYFQDQTEITGNKKVVVTQFDKAGTQLVLYKPNYPPGPGGKSCLDSAQKTIEVVDIAADFEIDKSRSGPLDIYFKNLSQNALSYRWDFGHPQSGVLNQSTDVDGFHLYFPDKGIFNVCLIARNKFDCEDTLCKPIELNYDPHIFIPNVFTPGDGNSINEVFDIDIEGEVSYDLKIYNRHSQLVYKSGIDGEGNDGHNWNGTNQDGELLPAGVYYVVFRYAMYYEEEKTYTGTLTMIRR